MLCLMKRTPVCFVQLLDNLADEPVYYGSTVCLQAADGSFLVVDPNNGQIETRVRLLTSPFLMPKHYVFR